MTTVGQMLMAGVEGKKVTAEHRLFLRETGCGGVILFARNYESPKQVARFISELRDAAAGPLIVGVDQEGGRVARFRKGFTMLPPMAALGRAGSAGVELAGEVGALLGRELRAVGVDIDFAPVMDVANNPANQVIGDRAISCDPDEVALMGAAFIRAMQAEGVAACAKHFPGHGDTDVDSHLGLPVIDHERGRFESCELVPFRAAVEAGVASVMVAHISVPKLDSGAPASVSAEVIGGLLRRDLGFRGLVVSDDLNMQGIGRLYPPYEAGWRSVAAGADMILVCRFAHQQRACLEGIRRAVGEGWIDMAVVTRSLERIERFRQLYLSTEARPAMKVVGSREHRRVAERIQASSQLQSC